MDMFCSSIIPTINRDTLTRAACSVLDQRFDKAGFEVIVVNDSGQSLPEMDWRCSDRVQVINTNRRERSVARNTGAAVARGKYLHFLDDDDILLPGALEAFWSLDQSASADWLYGSYRTVDNEGRLIAEFHPGIAGNIFALLVAGEAIPLQASILNSQKFHAIGRFDPDPGITGVEDRDLGRRMALTNTVAHTSSVVASIRIGEQGSSTNWATIAESDRKGREKALSAPGALPRLYASATSSYWQGRVSRAYAASAAWNLKRGQLLTLTHRVVSGLCFTNWRWPHWAFWQGLRARAG